MQLWLIKYSFTIWGRMILFVQVKLSVYFCNNAIILSLRGLRDFMILQISHPLLSLFTLLPPWLMKLWDATRFSSTVCWVMEMCSCWSFKIYCQWSIIKNPILFSSWDLKSCEHDDLHISMSAPRHLSPSISCQIKHLNPNNSFELYKTKTVTPNIYDFMTWVCAIMLRGCLCALCPTFYQ